MQIQITPEQRSQIKQAATNLIASVDFGLPAKAITMSATLPFDPPESTSPDTRAAWDCCTFPRA
jgi:hypothetical protein